MRSPFSILEDDNPSLSYETKLIERQRAEYKPVRKINNMPFAKYQTIHPIKPAKTEQTKLTKQIKEKQKTNSSQQIKQQASNQAAIQSENQAPSKQSDHQNSPQQNSQSQLPIINNSTSITQSEYTDEDEQKTYFLTKKHRQTNYQLNSDGDPPLLYDIGLDAEMIKDKLRLVIKMGQPDYDMIMNPDLAGPVIIAFAFGFLLLFSGQIQFGDIYAMFIIGNLVMFLLFNFMAKKEVISLYNIMSILGYCLMPMLTLGGVGIFMRLNSGFGLLLGLMISLWSSVAGGNFIEALVRGKKNRKILIIYPLFLFYASFAMIVIF